MLIKKIKNNNSVNQTFYKIEENENRYVNMI